MAPAIAPYSVPRPPIATQMTTSMELIGAEGAGVVVLITSPMPGVFTRALQRKAGAADMEELRDYGVGAQILTELGVQDMVLLTNTHHTLVGLDGYGLSIVGEHPIPCSEKEA